MYGKAERTSRYFMLRAAKNRPILKADTIVKTSEGIISNKPSQPGKILKPASSRKKTIAANMKSTMLRAVADSGGISRGKYILFITPELVSMELLTVMSALEKP